MIPVNAAGVGLPRITGTRGIAAGRGPGASKNDMSDHDDVGADERDRQAARWFVRGVGWPLPAVALDALVDLGLSDEAIGRYFGVAAAEVRRRRLQIARPPRQ